MTFTAQEIKKFQDSFLKHRKIELTEKEARFWAEEIMSLYRAIYYPSELLNELYQSQK